MMKNQTSNSETSMDEKQEIYQLPDNTDQSIKHMLWFLGLFFGGLLIIATLVIVNAHWLAKKIPFSAEQRFVRPYEEAVRRWYPGDSNDEMDQYLQGLADELATAMELPENYELHLHYVNSDLVNAFATLGGHIFVFEGLINQMPDENSLAMVLAHEVAHIKHRDPVAAMGRGLAIQMLYGFITSDYSSSADMFTTSSELGMAFFSREQEKQADLEALVALAGHYGHVSGYADFFAAMKIEMEDQNATLPEWLSTHPDLENRINYLELEIDNSGYQTGDRTPVPEDILQLMENIPEPENAGADDVDAEES